MSISVITLMSFEVESTFWVWPNSMQEMLDVMYILKTPIFRYVNIQLVLHDCAYIWQFGTP